jgi:hypothetical protein
MVKKTITYPDFDGVERTDDFYFNLTQAELTELDIRYEGGLKAMVEKLSKTTDPVVVVEVFKDMIRKAYGEKSLDGKRFMKSQEITDSFTSTEAYSKLFMEFLQDSKAASDFVNGLVPAVASDKSKIPAPSK